MSLPSSERYGLISRNFYDVRDDESYWAAAVNEAAAINEKYNCQLCKDLLIAVSNELQRKGGVAVRGSCTTLSNNKK